MVPRNRTEREKRAGIINGMEKIQNKNRPLTDWGSKSKGKTRPLKCRGSKWVLSSLQGMPTYFQRRELLSRR